MTNSQMRRFQFTSFEDEPPEFDETTMKYMIYGAEVCPKTGTPHWQGYVEMGQPKRFNQMKKLWPTFHIEACWAGFEKNKVYCSKDGKWVEFGVPNRPGTRTDRHEVADACVRGDRYGEIAMEYPEQFIKFHKGIRVLCDIVAKKKAKDWREVKVHVLIGPPRCGKTRSAIEFSNDYFKKSAGCPWFDGYDNEETLILDEISSNSHPTYEKLLEITEGHPCQVPYKGGMTWARWNTVFITSNQPIERWYGSTQDISALKSRITTVKDYSVTEVVGNTKPQPPTDLKATPRRVH